MVIEILRTPVARHTVVTGALHSGGANRAPSQFIRVVLITALWVDYQPIDRVLDCELYVVVDEDYHQPVSESEYRPQDGLCHALDGGGDEYLMYDDLSYAQDCGYDLLFRRGQGVGVYLGVGLGLGGSLSLRFCHYFNHEFSNIEAFLYYKIPL